MSEEKRYSGKDFVEKTKKGDVKQESWMEMIKSIIMHESNLKPQHKNLLETISSYNNVPRKRVKFIVSMNNLICIRFIRHIDISEFHKKFDWR